LGKPSVGIELLSKQVFEGAAPGHILAMETKNSDIDFFFLVRVVEKVEQLQRGGTFEVLLVFSTFSAKSV
jgi:hypothetical protein